MHGCLPMLWSNVNSAQNYIASAGPFRTTPCYAREKTNEFQCFEKTTGRDIYCLIVAPALRYPCVGFKALPAHLSDGQCNCMRVITSPLYVEICTTADLLCHKGINFKQASIPLLSILSGTVYAQYSTDPTTGTIAFQKMSLR